MDDLTGKVALVTGGSRGIGREIALALAQAGCDVAISYHTQEQEAREVVQQIEQAGCNAFGMQLDIGVAAEAAEFVREAEHALGSIGIVVNNAGMAKPQPQEIISVADWDEVLRVNLTSAFTVTQAALPAMRLQKWGRIIMLSSIAAQTGGVVGPHYAASKAGMIGLMRSYASTLATEGITANAVAPALIETDMVRDNPRAKPDLLPVARFGQPREVADVVLMLVRNGFITGQTINVNGGWYMN